MTITTIITSEAAIESDKALPTVVCQLAFSEKLNSEATVSDQKKAVRRCLSPSGPNGPFGTLKLDENIA